MRQKENMKSKKMKKLVIDRALWVNAGSKTEQERTALLNDEGRMCCLGFCARQLGGATENDIKGVGIPALTQAGSFKWPQGILTRAGFSTETTSGLIRANDDASIARSRRTREQKVAELFASIGIEVQFVGKYPEDTINYTTRKAVAENRL